MKKALIVALSLGLAWTLCGPVYGATIHVPGDQPTIQAGIDGASNGDTVLVADGTYTGEENEDLNFNGKAITVQSENGNDSCTIACKYGPAFRFHSGEGEESVVSGFTITNCGCWETGAILCEDSSPTIKNCSFSKNFGFIGAIDKTGGSLTITNCSFSGNSGFLEGAICSYGGSLTITDSSFFDPRLCNLHDDFASEPVVGLNSYPTTGGYVDIRDDAIADYVHMGRPRVHWPAYNSANGETRPGLEH